MTPAILAPSRSFARSRGALVPARLLGGPSRSDAESWVEHNSRLGGAISSARGRHHPAQLIAMIRRAGLTGRGGAGFPAADKLAAVRGQPRSPVVVGNGSETEPAAAKDDLLLRLRPHLVLDGLELVAATLRAERIFLVVPSTLAERSVSRALRERESESSLGPAVEVALGPTNFVGGEETALVRWLEGLAAVPRFQPPRGFERGWRGKPTLVQNVETLAHLGLIARYGPEWFRQQGTDEEPGTCLVTLSGAVSHPGVYEVSIGMPLSELLAAAGADPSAAALLAGGYFGSWLQPAQFPAARVSRAGLRELGASPGAGVFHLLAPGNCVVRESQRLVRWLAGESAGQCGPCAQGLPAMAETLERLSDPLQATEQGVRQITRWCAQVENRGACRHPDGVVNLIRSTLSDFGAEVELHIRARCSGSVSNPLPLPRAWERAE